MPRYFGFMMFPLGSGAAFLFSGVLLIGVQGQLGLAAGLSSTVWGGLTILAHVYLRCKHLGAVNVPLRGGRGGGDGVTIATKGPAPPPPAPYNTA